MLSDRDKMDACQWLPATYRRSTTPVSVPIDVDDPVFPRESADEDDEDDGRLRLIDVDLEDAHAQLELELGWGSAFEMDHLPSPPSGEESSGEEDDEIDRYAALRQQQHSLNTCVPHALEVQALFPSDDETLCAASSWSNPGSEFDDEIDSEVEVAATWSGPLNPAKRRMGIYY